MTSSIGFKKWLVLFSVILISVTASLVTANYFIDYYGLFRDVEGKKLMPYDNFRLAKYLYSYNYIPVNYDGILIGTSASINLDTSKIVKRNVYNASVDVAGFDNALPAILAASRGMYYWSRSFTEEGIKLAQEGLNVCSKWLDKARFLYPKTAADRKPRYGNKEGIEALRSDGQQELQELGETGYTREQVRREESEPLLSQFSTPLARSLSPRLPVYRGATPRTASATRENTWQGTSFGVAYFIMICDRVARGTTRSSDGAGETET